MAVVLKKTQTNKTKARTTTTKHCDKTNRIHTRARTSLVWFVAKCCHPLLDIYITITNELFRNNKRACRPHRTTHHGTDSKFVRLCLCAPPPPLEKRERERERVGGGGGRTDTDERTVENTDKGIQAKDREKTYRQEDKRTNRANKPIAFVSA